MGKNDWISPKVNKKLIKLSIYFLISLTSFYIIAELIGYGSDAKLHFTKKHVVF